ncbi:MAG: hypothetical protein BWY63_02448 [Chloroflexi bacterium ADurb.Bin360]|nr:MAG: hypothetical protein BWY63_02448 [Chloroflexi bacterium ADurb.Bin360]
MRLFNLTPRGDDAAAGRSRGGNLIGEFRRFIRHRSILERRRHPVAIAIIIPLRLLYFLRCQFHIAFELGELLFRRALFDPGIASLGSTQSSLGFGDFSRCSRFEYLRQLNLRLFQAQLGFCDKQLEVSGVQTRERLPLGHGVADRDPYLSDLPGAAKCQRLLLRRREIAATLNRILQRAARHQNQLGDLLGGGRLRSAGPEVGGVDPDSNRSESG